MADEIRLRVIGEERGHLAAIRRHPGYGRTDSEIVRTLLEREAAKLQANRPLLERIAALAHEIELLADSAAPAAESRTK